jgi:hypothetical protein
MWKMDLTGGVCVSVRRSGEKGKAVVGPLCGPAQVLEEVGPRAFKQKAREEGFGLRRKKGFGPSWIGRNFSF